MKLVPRNWGEFQHYKNRRPPWIKLHHDLLDNADFHGLQDASRALAPCLWLIASEDEGGEIDARPENLAFRLRKPWEWIEPALTELINKGFFEADSELLALCKQVAMPETERERETETEGEAELRVSVSKSNPPTNQISSSTKTARANGHSAESVALLAFLNERTGKNFRPVAANLKLIDARLNSGVPPIRVKQVILRKWREWKDRPEMHVYLRPETLFGATKFEQYLGEIPAEALFEDTTTEAT